MKLTKLIGIAIALLFIVNFLQAQTALRDTATNEQAPPLPVSYYDKVEQKFSNVTGKLNKQTHKAIRKFRRQEAKLQKLLAKKDSATTAAIFNGTADYLQNLQQQFASVGDKAINKLQAEYNAYLDTLKTTFKFLEKAGGQGNAASAKLQAAMSKVNILEGKFLKAEEIKKYLRERKELLKQQLQRFGLSQKIKQLDKSVYYYGQYVKEFKETIKDPKRIEEKALALLSKSSIYKKFVAENSLLSSLFKLPGSGDGAGMVQNLAGLQTRQTVGAMIADRVGSGGPNAINAVRQQIQSGMQQLNALKDKMAQYGSADGEAELPNFTPNHTKTKPVSKRIVYDANIGFGKINSISANSTADIALGIGYKLNDKSTIGIGAGYKLGLGSIQRIRLSGQGINLRSYIDWKLKKQFYISGGYELNYLPTLQELSIPSPLGNRAAEVWHASGLIGISKKISVKTKWVKSTKIQLLYDILYQQHRPATQPFVFRVGYSLK